MTVQELIFLYPNIPGETPILYKQSVDIITVAAVFKNSETGNPYTLTDGTVFAFNSDAETITDEIIDSITLDEDNGTIIATIKGGLSGDKIHLAFDAESEDFPLMRGSAKLRIKDVRA
jgi:hypothetical protein